MSKLNDGERRLWIYCRLQEIPGLKQFKVVQNRDFSVDLFVRIASGMESTVGEELEEACVELLDKTPTRIVPVERIELVPGQKFRIVESKLTSRA